VVIPPDVSFDSAPEAKPRSGRAAGPVLQKANVYAARENHPPFTLRLAAAFVNGKTCVSTGFFTVLPCFLVFSQKKHPRG
jgi:hypothetical protein